MKDDCEVLIQLRSELRPRDDLTPHEIAGLRLNANTNKEIAAQLSIGEANVKATRRDTLEARREGPSPCCHNRVEARNYRAMAPPKRGAGDLHLGVELVANT